MNKPSAHTDILQKFRRLRQVMEHCKDYFSRTEIYWIECIIAGMEEGAQWCSPPDQAQLRYANELWDKAQEFDPWKKI